MDTAYKGYSFGLGIVYIPIRRKRFELRIFSNIMANKISIELHPENSTKKFYSNGIEYINGFSLNVPIYLDLFISLSGEYNVTKIKIKYNNQIKKYNRSLAGGNLGVGWNF